jgi:hypothetical protein
MRHLLSPFTFCTSLGHTWLSSVLTSTTLSTLPCANATQCLCVIWSRQSLFAHHLGAHDFCLCSIGRVWLVKFIWSMDQIFFTNYPPTTLSTLPCTHATQCLCVIWSRQSRFAHHLGTHDFRLCSPVTTFSTSHMHLIDSPLTDNRTSPATTLLHDQQLGQEQGQTQAPLPLTVWSSVKDEKWYKI